MKAISAEQYKVRQTEAQFQRTVTDYAEKQGWLCVHFPAMLANPSGWPDLILIRGRRTIFAELKREGGKLGPKQEETIGSLRHVGAEAYVWFPSDWPAIEAALRGE